MKYLALFLRAPMQSWGAASKFGDRGTLDVPTRSGLLGLLAAACGIDKNDEPNEREWLAKADKLSLTVLAFRRGNRMTDYHTVGAHYDKDNAWQKRMIPTTADSKPRGTDLTRRDYLTDSVFGAMLSGDDMLVVEMATGLANPVWGVWLGRKSCIPTEPILAGVFGSAEEAEVALLERFRRTATPSDIDKCSVVFSVLETTTDNAEETTLDIPVSFARREFHARRIQRLYGEET